MRKLFTILFLFPLLAFSQQAFYVSTTGNSGNSGSFASPWDLQTALDHPGTVDPGDTIFILAGTYTGIYTSDLTGTSGNPIIVKAQGRVIIDGTLDGEADTRINVLTINGAYTWYWGFEVTNSSTDRTGLFSGPTGRGPGFSVGTLSGGGVGVKIINCIVYDCGQGITMWSPAIGAEAYGNVVFNNGWYATDNEEGTGHGVYSQNVTGTKLYKDNIIWGQFGLGFHVYAEEGDLKGFYLEGNIHFSDGFLMGGYTPAEDIELNTNFFYNGGASFGMISQPNDNLDLINNYIPSSSLIRYWTNVTATGNTFFTTNPAESVIGFVFSGGFDVSTWDFSGNNYYDQSAIDPFQFYFNDNVTDGPLSIEDWQDEGQDLDATVAILPAPYKTVTRINAYDPNRAHVAVYNWNDASTRNISVSGILTAGDTYELRSAIDYFGDVITGTFLGGDSLNIPMTGHSLALPLGYGSSFGSNTFPTFGAFVLIKTDDGSLPHVTPVPDRGQAGAVKISRNTGSGLPHVTLGTGTGSGLPALRDNLLVDEGFEGGDPWPTDVFVLSQDNLGATVDLCGGGSGTNTWAREQLSDHPFSGSSYHKIEVRCGCDGCKSSGFRSEMRLHEDLDAQVAQINTTEWYGYSLYFDDPESGGEFSGNSSGVFTQWHPTNSSGAATVALYNNYNTNGGWTLALNEDGLSGEDEVIDSNIPITANTWHHVVWKIFWGSANNGYIKVWIDGDLVFDTDAQLERGLDFNTEGQYFKLGMNRWGSQNVACCGGGNIAPTVTWKIGWDNFRISGPGGTYNDVAPVQVLPEPRPIPVVDSLPKGVLTPIDTSKRIQVYYRGVPTVTTPKLTVIPERSYSKCCGTPFGMFCYCSPAPDLRDSIISIDTIKLSIWGEPIPPPTKSRIKLYDPDTVKGKRAIICEYKDINRIMNGPPVLYREIK